MNTVGLCKSSRLGICSIAVEGEGPVGSNAGDLTKAERERAIDLLEKSREDLLRAVESLTDEQWNFRPTEGIWSAGDVVQHLARAEKGMFIAVQRAAAAAPDPDWAGKTDGKLEQLERHVLNREAKIQAPERILPTPDLSRAEVMDRYSGGRDKSLGFIRSSTLPLKAHLFETPFPFLGTLNAYQWLVYIALHNLRHNEQVNELLSHPGFPG